jgi:hypothetical protein
LGFLKTDDFASASEMPYCYTSWYFLARFSPLDAVVTNDKRTLTEQQFCGGGGSNCSKETDALSSRVVF